MTDQSLTLQYFIEGQFPQIHCEKCETTFLTNVYDYSAQQVLLEKRSYGLEYFCGAIHEMGVKLIPDIRRLGVIDENDRIVTPPDRELIYSGHEAEFRFLYIMERLEHLQDSDAAYFDRCVKDLEWQNEADRDKIIRGIARRYNPQLADDVLKLYRYYKRFDSIIAWDLHGDNLMLRLDASGKAGEVVILDPYTRRV